MVLVNYAKLKRLFSDEKFSNNYINNFFSKDVVFLTASKRNFAEYLLAASRIYEKTNKSNN